MKKHMKKYKILFQGKNITLRKESLAALEKVGHHTTNSKTLTFTPSIWSC